LAVFGIHPSEFAQATILLNNIYQALFCIQQTKNIANNIQSLTNSITNIMSGPKETSDQPGSNYKEEVPKGRKPVDNQTVRKPNDSKPNKPVKTDEPAKQRENEEQPVHPVKDAPKED